MHADEVLVDAFLAAVDERRDAEEFERLMLGDADTDVWKELQRNRGRLNVSLDLFDLRARDWDDQSPALTQLKTQRALERLQARYPDLWEQVFVNG